MRKQLALKWIIAAVIALIVLELALASAGAPTYFPPDIGDDSQLLYEPAPWWTCDETSCRYDYEAAGAACANGEIAGRNCIVNRQGFSDTQDFTAGDDFDQRLRILMLGDETAFGTAAEIGKSYVETIESNFPQSIVWNTGLPGAGTNQAVVAFQLYAPALRPHLTVLGFSASGDSSDFIDNLLPVDRWLRTKSDPNRAIPQYRIDSQGNVIKLDHRRLYYRAHGVEPPASEIERLIGAARLGTAALNALDALFGIEYELIVNRQVIDVTRQYLRTLRDSAAAQDAPLLALLIPSHTYTGDPSRRYQIAIELMQELRIPWLDPLHALDAELDYTAAPGSSHWSTAGHQKIGAMLSACLEVFQISRDLSDCEPVQMP